MKERIEQVLRTTERAGIEDLLEWMDQNGFYSAPCSTKYHFSKPGGLAEHSLNVFGNAIRLTTELYNDCKNLTFDFIDSVTICALLHDIGKVGQFGKENYVINTDPENPAPYCTNKDLLFVPHEIRSIAILSKFIDLTEEEQFAILYHNGLYGELKSFKGKETPLYMIIHAADMWASRVTEREEK